MATAKKFRLVQNVDGTFIKTEWNNVGDFLAGADVRGFEFVKLNSNPRQRAELQGAPVFQNLCGPMWDGDAVRYEDQSSNDILSN